MNRILAIGLILLCLILFAACSSKPRVVTMTEVVRVKPPSHLMEPTPEPDCSQARTNGDLVQCIVDYRAALRRSNADKVAMAQSVGRIGK